MASSMNSDKSRQYSAVFSDWGTAVLSIKDGDTEEVQTNTAKSLCWLDEDAVVEEIENNLMSLPETAREAYLFGVLTKFRAWSNILYPEREIDRLGANITECEAIYNKLDDEHEAEKQQCVRMMVKFNEMSMKLRQKADEAKQKVKTGQCASIWAASIKQFGTALDAVLLRNGYDLMALQAECGVYLLEKRDTESLVNYLGRGRLVTKFVDAVTVEQEEKDIKVIPHFNSTLPKNVLNVIRQRLVKYGFISDSVTLDDWLYICTGTGDPVEKPIDLNGTSKTLAYLVGRYIGKDDENLWVIAAKAFTYKGKKPNRNVMKNDMSELKDLTGFALKVQDKNIYNFAKIFSDLNI